MTITAPSPNLQPWYSILAGAVLAACIVRVVFNLRRRNPRKLPYPPGPKGQFIVGNLNHIPQGQPWLGYHEICKKHGDMVHLRILGAEILVLDSIKHANALLDRRAANYSDRPDMPAAHIMGTYWAFAIMPYGNVWRQHRRAFHQYLGQSAQVAYHPIAQLERDNLLRRLKDDPLDFIEHIKLFVGMIIMRTTYGFDDPGKNAKLIKTAEQVVREFTSATAPGKFLVSAFPILRHVPAWFPGAGWKRYMKKAAELNWKLVNIPFDDAKNNLVKGERPPFPSMLTNLVDNLPESNSPERAHAEHVAKNVFAQSYTAGSESTAASATALLIALANNPDVQRRAHAELNSVIGSHRLPAVSDRASLPYVHAIVKELLRWHTATPLGFVHCSTEDDEYEGYFIAKGTLVIPNAWSMMHDPGTFDRPDEFDPERFLKGGKIDPSVPDPDLANFGFGRRICPGKFFVSDLLFLFAASVLATFDVAHPQDSSGDPLELKLDFGSGVVAAPCAFKCKITVRPGAEALVA